MTIENKPKLGGLAPAAKPSAIPQLPAPPPLPSPAASLIAGILAGESCGSKRWLVKTLADPDAGRVDLKPVASSVAELIKLAPPAMPPANARAAPVELTERRHEKGISFSNQATFRRQTLLHSAGTSIQLD